MILASNWPKSARGLAGGFGLVTAKEFAQRIAGPLLFVGFAIIALLVVDVALYVASGALGIRVDAATWGTYAAWASALLPTVGVVATVGIWLVNQRDRDARDALDQAVLVSVERQEGAVASIHNQSSWAIEIVDVEPPMIEVLGRIVRPNGPRLLLGPDTRSAKYRVKGIVFEQDIEGSVVRVPSVIS